MAELGETEFLRRLQQRLEAAPLRLVLREPQLSPTAYSALAKQIIPLVKAQSGTILLHGQIELARELGADGVPTYRRRYWPCSAHAQTGWIG